MRRSLRRTFFRPEVLRHFENRKAGIPFSSPEPVASWLQIKPSGSGDENAGIQETEARALVRMSYGFCALSRAILFQRFFRNWDRSRTSTPCAFHLPRKWQQIQIYCVWQDRKLVQLSQNRLWVACLLLTCSAWPLNKVADVRTFLSSVWLIFLFASELNWIEFNSLFTLYKIFT